jgi:hypothetical protein
MQILLEKSSIRTTMALPAGAHSVQFPYKVCMAVMLPARTAFLCNDSFVDFSAYVDQQVHVHACSVTYRR